jgi:nitroreductase
MRNPFLFIIEPFNLLRAFLSDYSLYMKAHSSKYTLSNLERQTLLLSHALEKGMCFVNKRENWGGVKASSLTKLLKKYTALEGTSPEILSFATNILQAYTEDAYSSKDPQLLNQIHEVIAMNRQYLNKEISGVKEISEPSAFNEKDIETFFNSRSSVRFFSDAPITTTEIQKALQFATCTPTACNRQSSRVYAFRDKTTIRKILDLQLGDQGWCNNADTLFVITGVASYFGGVYERNQVYIDGGLFAMNFVYGLHLQHIASCYKMFVRIPSVMEELRAVCGIPGNEIPIILIPAGHYLPHAVHGPKSHRFHIPAKLDGQVI